MGTKRISESMMECGDLPCTGDSDICLCADCDACRHLAFWFFLIPLYAQVTVRQG